jgi:hypothetical protein
MKKFMLAGWVLLPCLALAQSAPPPAALSGDYVEVRSASVFAGACHFNGENVTTGRDAILAWNVHRGDWKGTRLEGVRAMAVVSSPSNLADKAAHRSELIIDSAASDRQVSAIVEALKQTYGASLGDVVAVRRAPIQFDHAGKSYAVRAGDLAELSVESMPNNECCKMPHQVWYEPLVPLMERKVGYTKDARYAGGAVADSWQRADENSAFYGKFFI